MKMNSWTEKAKKYEILNLGSCPLFLHTGDMLPVEVRFQVVNSESYMIIGRHKPLNLGTSSGQDHSSKTKDSNTHTHSHTHTNITFIQHNYNKHTHMQKCILVRSHIHTHHHHHYRDCTESVAHRASFTTQN